MNKIRYYYQKNKHEDCLEELYIQSKSFTKDRYVIPIEAFCIIYNQWGEITDFYMVDFPLEVREKEIRETTKSRYDKNLEIGRKFKKNKLRTFNYKVIV